MSDHTPADLLLRHAPVWDGVGWAGDHLAIRDGVILAVGTADHVARVVGPDTEVRDLDGRWLLPAFHDAHVHPVQGGTELGQCDLTGTTDVDAYLERVAAYAAAHPDLPWICGGGWSMGSFPGGVPTADLLDRVCPDRPVYLPNRDHHSAWVNTRALELAGIDEATPDPADGRIERDADGRATGALHEGAMGLVARLVPAPTAEELLEALLRAQRHLHSLGIAGWQDALVGEGLGMPDALPVYVEARRRRLLTAKVRLALWWDRDAGLEQLDALRERRRAAAEAGLRADSVKIMLDGVCETHTAAMLDPYRDAHGASTGATGLSFVDAGTLAAAVTALDAEGIQVHIHALGDRAVRESLDAIEAARGANGPRGNRHHLAHVQVVSPDDVERFAALDAIVNAQPLWACRDDSMVDLTLPFMPDSARERQYVFGSLAAAGARIAFGSDWPVSSPDPIAGIHVAVNRREPGAPADVEPLQPEEALDRPTALSAYTAGSAFVNGLEQSSGRLAVGCAADVVVVDADVLAVPAERLADTRVRLTLVDGQVVHEAP